MGGMDLRTSVFDSLPDAAAVVDHAGVIRHVNPVWRTFAALNGGAEAATGAGVGYLDVCRRAAAGGDPDAGFVAEGLAAVLAGRARRFEHRYPCPSPIEHRWFVVRISPLAGGGGAVVCHLDVTAAKLAEDRLVHRASHDALTGLPNRDAVLAHLRTAVARLRRTGAPLAVLFLDLDRFKPVNDRFGHELGDRLLVQVAHRLERQLRATDLVGRMGGDEFVVVCEGIDAAAVADRLRAVVSAPLQVGDESVRVGVSIGVAVATDDGGDAEQLARSLLSRADAAMYADKRARLPSPA